MVIMKLIIVVFALTVAVTTASPFDSEWIAFKKEHNKVYTGVLHDKHRKRIFIKNLNFIKRHNEEADNGIHFYRLAVNQFADLNSSEFNELYNKLELRDHVSSSGTFTSTNVNISASVDWRQKGAVTYVRTQGVCGSCWAFSAVASLEGQYFRNTSVLMSLSEQQLIDCTSEDGNTGCKGGEMTRAFNGIKRMGGIESEDHYPYRGSNKNCSFNQHQVVFAIDGYKQIESGNETDLTAAIASIGPISVAVDASSMAFRFYDQGIFDLPSCNNIHLNHAVTAVGYGSENGTDYYIVKNSWSSSWGEGGYIRMSRNKDNQCGIANDATYPVI